MGGQHLRHRRRRAHVEALRTYFSDALYDQNLEDASMDSLLDNAAFRIAQRGARLLRLHVPELLLPAGQLLQQRSGHHRQAQGYTDANAMAGLPSTRQGGVITTHLAIQDLLYQAICREPWAFEPPQEQLDAAAASYSGSSYRRQLRPSDRPADG